MLAKISAAVLLMLPSAFNIWPLRLQCVEPLFTQRFSIESYTENHKRARAYLHLYKNLRIMLGVSLKNKEQICACICENKDVAVHSNALFKMMRMRYRALWGHLYGPHTRARIHRAFTNYSQVDSGAMRRL